MSGAATSLLLIDGHAAAYRFFHGIRPMTTQSGVPVHAVFGLIRLLQQFRSQFMPTHIAVAFDGGLPANRLSLVPEYKAQRKPMPDDLRAQLPIMQEYLTAAAIPCFCQDAVEADDVIATLAARASGRVLIGTSDKDLFQLVSERVSIIPLSGQAVCLDPAGVKVKTGVGPEQIPDWLALTGDTADNIGGVPGVGPKTAAALLQQFGSLEEIYLHLDQVTRENLRQALAQHREVVQRNRQMVLLDTEIDGLPDFDALACTREPVSTLQAFYEKYEFRAFAQKLRAPELF